MKRTVIVHKSFAAAAAADKAYYKSLTPAERIRLLLELRNQYHPYSNEAAAGFKRVYRIVKRT